MVLHLYFSALRSPLILTKSPTPFETGMPPQTCKGPLSCFSVTCRRSCLKCSPAPWQTDYLLLDKYWKHNPELLSFFCSLFCVFIQRLSFLALFPNQWNGIWLKSFHKDHVWLCFWLYVQTVDRCIRFQLVSARLELMALLNIFNLWWYVSLCLLWATRSVLDHCISIP